jgi:hypothetical protein
MRSIVLNLIFLVGYGFCVAAAFEVSKAFGLAVIGLPMLAISIYLQNKEARK